MRSSSIASSSSSYVSEHLGALYRLGGHVTIVGVGEVSRRIPVLLISEGFSRRTSRPCTKALRGSGSRRGILFPSIVSRNSTCMGGVFMRTASTRALNHRSSSICPRAKHSSPTCRLSGTISTSQSAAASGILSPVMRQSCSVALYPESFLRYAMRTFLAHTSPKGWKRRPSGANPGLCQRTSTSPLALTAWMVASHHCFERGHCACTRSPTINILFADSATDPEANASVLGRVRNRRPRSSTARGVGVEGVLTDGLSWDRLIVRSCNAEVACCCISSTCASSKSSCSITRSLSSGESYERARSRFRRGFA
mmetsp:Transcript_33656/g.83919  ORF Transcript_33656/g.83919 Transcript_33656/m.83919 type:complete len:311 (-) Transcript_33656:807-1739(-)